MPRRDGTGPMGIGPMAGRDLGAGANAFKCNAGSGYGLSRRCGFRRDFGRGTGRCFSINQTNVKTQKELLEEQKEFFKNQLDVIDEELKNL